MEIHCQTPLNSPIFPACVHNKSSDENNKIFNENKCETNKDLEGYRGDIFQNCLHGCGKYSWIENGIEIVYEGQFFANSLEGYGRVKYSTGEIFEGLFKESRRFGPGIFTYSYGFQDVGFWDGRYLIRLICAANSESIPCLSNSTAAKTQLLNYRKLVSVCPSVKDPATDILKAHKINSNWINQSQRLYNSDVRARGSVFFNNPAFHKLFFGCHADDCNIQLELLLDEQNKASKKAKDKKQSVSSINKDIEERDSVFDVECESSCHIYTEDIRMQELDEQIRTLNELIRIVLIKEAKAVAEFKRLKKMSKSTHQLSENLYEEEEEMEEEKLEEISITDEASDESSTTAFDEVPLLKIVIDYLENLKSNYQRMKSNQSSSTRLLLDDTEKKYFEKIKELIDILLYNKNLLVDEKDNMINKLKEIKDQHEVINKNRFKNVKVNEILAWNNEELIIEMMTHSFINRHMEEKLSYDLSSFFTGKRSKYLKCGPYEEECIHFLKNCSEGNTNELNKIGRKFLNPDISDCQGNTGIFVAVAKDNTTVIRTLKNLGGAINIFNDENLTPLSLSLCKYLAVLFDVTNWEKAFLPPTFTQKYLYDNLLVWKSCACVETDSFHLDLPEEIDSAPNINVLQNINDFSDEHQQYLLNVDCVKPAQKKEKKKANQKKKNKKIKEDKENKKKKKDKSNASTTGKKSKKNKEEKEKKEEEIAEQKKKEKEKKLRIIYNTISLLLDVGANPNFGEVPLPSLILSLFTDNANLVRQILSYQADPNIRSFENQMTPLHYMVSKAVTENCLDILVALLDYKANPNLLTSPSHWLNEKKAVIGKENLRVQDYGKTPLHILCMRYDFVYDQEHIMNQMATVLIGYKASTDVQYLGHTPLTLAMLRGNVLLVEELLKTCKCDPNQLLGNEMGVPLVVLLLKRYLGIQPEEICEKIIDILIQYNANPFNIISGYGNAIEFIHNEYKPQPKDKKDKKKKSPKKDKQKSNKGSDKSKKEAQQLIKYFINCSRNVLTRYVQAKCVKYLFIFISENYYHVEFLPYMARFITPQECVDILQILVANRRIEVNEKCKEIANKILNYIQEVDQQLSSDRSRRSSIRRSPKEPSVNELLDNFNTAKVKYHSSYPTAFPPELDRMKKKYKVCFNCCCAEGKELIRCPLCCVVYFCSEACNKQCNRLKTRHRCKSLFYKSEKNRIRDQEILGILEESPLEMWLKKIAEAVKQRTQILELEKKLEKEWEMIYGKRTGKVSKEQERRKSEFMNQKMSVVFGDNWKSLGEVEKNVEKTDDKVQKRFITQSKTAKPTNGPPSKTNNITKDTRTFNNTNLNSTKAKSYSKQKSLPVKSQSPKSPKTFAKSPTSSTKKEYHTSQNKNDASESQKQYSQAQSNSKRLEKSKTSSRSAGNSPERNQLSPKSKGNKKFRSLSLTEVESYLKANTGSVQQFRSSINAVRKLFQSGIIKDLGSKSLSPVRTKEQMERWLKNKVFEFSYAQKAGNIMSDFFIRLPNTVRDQFKLGSQRPEPLMCEPLDESSKIPTKFQALLEELTENISDVDLTKLLLPYTCFSRDQLYYRFKESTTSPFCGTYSDV